MSDARALHAEVADFIRQRKADDPFAAVTLVVDSPLSGMLLRRQLVARGHLGDGTCNIRVLTAADLITEVADHAGIAVPVDVPRVVREAVIAAVLEAKPGPFSTGFDHPSTAQRLSDTFDELAWCPLTADDVERAADAASTTVTPGLLNLIQDVRAALGSRPGGQAIPDLVDQVLAALPQDEPRARLTTLGTLIVVAQHVPDPVSRLLAAMAGHIPVRRLRLAPNANPAPHSIRDCPDPATEVAFAVRTAVGAMADGVRPEQIAVVYGAENPYASLLSDELDRAGIAWHGPTVTTLGATALARVVAVILTMAATRRAGEGSGISRPLLLRWFDAAPLHDGDERLRSWWWRRLIRDNKLFGDAGKWGPALLKLSESPEPENAGDDEESLARRRKQRAEPAASFTVFLDRVGETLDRLVAAPTWRDLGEELWATLENYHLQAGWWRTDPAERQARQRLRDLLLQELPELDQLTGSGTITGIAAPTPVALQQVIEHDLHRRHGRHGDVGTGLYVNALRPASLLVFEQVIVLGAVEGVLPALRGEDPLLPDAVRETLRRTPADLPTATDRIRVVECQYRSIVTAAAKADITRPRGALPGHETTHPSRFLPPAKAAASVRVGSCWASLTQRPWPATENDIRLRALLADPGDVPASLEAPVATARAFRRPEFDRFHGNLSDCGARTPVWDIATRALSASAVESFLDCPYHFFVQHVLGLDTEKVVDEIHEVTARDLGTMLHRALDLFVCAARDAGWLPGPGEPWPGHAQLELRSLFDDVIAVTAAEGRTGWAPSWQYHYERVVAAFGDLLKKDTELVRGAPPAAPHESELSFGDDDDPLTVTLADGTAVRLRGIIDRLDVGADGTATGIVDYKSGKSRGFRAKLGISHAHSAHERQNVQDLVYDVAVRAMYPDAHRIDIRFVFVPDDGEITIVAADHDPDRLEKLTAILTDLRTAGVQGRFPPKPRGRYDYCTVCDRLGHSATVVAESADIPEPPDAQEPQP